MITHPRISQPILFALALLSVVSLKATPITVSELGVGAGETVWINSSSLGNNLHVYASVVKLNVGGAYMDGFCIDPWHWSASGALPYDLEPLANAPKSANNSSANPMGASAAKQIEQLWKQYYTAGISNVYAAALQIKIWQIVDNAVSNGSFSLLSVDGGDSAAVYLTLTAMDNFLLNNPNAPTANLVAVTGSGQDYVIPNVPESGVTVLLLGVVFAGLAALRRRFVG